MKITALQLKQNPLFRLLAFLDNTNAQEFVLKEEVDAKGEFVNPARLFAKDATAIGTILQHSVDAFKENVERFFENDDEKKAILSVMTTNVTTPPDAPRGLALLEQEAPVPAEEPVAMRWDEKICCPSSFAEFVGLIESSFPLFMSMRLLEVLQVDLAQCGSPFPLSEQFLIDGIDRWFSSLEPAEADRIPLACGVQPSVLEALKNTASSFAQEPILNFLIDILFPTKDMLSNTENNDQVMDWLLESYLRNRETVDVEAEPSAEDEEAQEDTEEQPARKKAKITEDQGLEGWSPSKDEMVLTAENIDYYMKEKPSLVPRNILIERRRSWMDPAIKEEELQNHYTAKELRKIVEEIAAQEGNPPPVSAELRSKASRATKKEHFIQVILQMHKEAMQDINVAE